MKLTIEPRNFFWWLWIITMGFIASAVAGWIPGYYVVMALSALQVIIFLVREKDKLAFPTQVRIIYFCLTLLGLWKAVRLPFYAILLLSTFMGTVLGRCTITLLIRNASWNKNRPARLY